MYHKCETEAKFISTQISFFVVYEWVTNIIRQRRSMWITNLFEYIESFQSKNTIAWWPSGLAGWQMLASFISYWSLSSLVPHWPIALVTQEISQPSWLVFRGKAPPEEGRPFISSQFSTSNSFAGASPVKTKDREMVGKITPALSSAWCKFWDLVLGSFEKCLS